MPRGSKAQGSALDPLGLRPQSPQFGEAASAGSAAEREAAREATRQRARDAFERGEAAFAAGQDDEAGRWLERAHRLARADLTVAFSLALLRLRQKDPARAAALLLPVVRATSRFDALVSLAIARRMQGLAAEAAFLLAEALGRHAVDGADAAIARVADAIAAEAGEAAWAAVTADGRVFLRPVERGLHLAVFLDDAQVGGAGPTHPGDTPAIGLPASWRTARTLLVQARGPGGLRRVLGGTIDLRAVLRVDGVVEADGRNGLTGWARHTNPAAGRPGLTVSTLAGRALLTLDPAPFTGAFAVEAARLPAGPVRVVDRNGRDLPGSPIDPGLEDRAMAALAAIAAGATARGPLAAAARFLPIPATFVGSRRTVAPAAGGRPARRPGIAVVVPAYGGGARTLACLDSLASSLPRGVPVHVVDDASPEPALVAALDERARSGAILLHRHPGGGNRGFPASANLGFVAADGRDVVLLNSDTLVCGDWLARLRRAAYAAPDIGTVTPLTNEGSIFGYPKPRHLNDMPDAAGTARLHEAASRANDGVAIEVPTGNGFCMFIRRACLDQVGVLREDLFAQGYGEENDFCLRARHAGWRHVAALDVYVAHAGAASFGPGREALMRRNLAVLNRLHPGYDALVARHIADDPLAPVRRRLDLARLRASEATDAANENAPSVLLVTHQAGGGVERFIRARIRALRSEGLRAVVLRGDPDGERTDLCLVEPHGRTDLPNLRYVLPTEEGPLLDLLRAFRPERVEIHHLLGHERSIAAVCRALERPTDIWVHDWAWFCPRISLLGPAHTYCGEPDLDGCRRCIAEAGSHLGDDLPVDAVIAQSAALLAGARRVVAATDDGAARLRAHFPGVAVAVSPWEPAPARVPPPPATRALAPEAPLTVAILGAIGPEKGIELVIACARDAAARRLPLRFVVVGHTSEDDRLLAAGPAFVTGPYDEDETADLLAAQRADLALLPAIWPETWCYTLSECWRAGLFVFAFDIGAPAERIRAAGGGALLPLGTEPGRVNDALVAAVQQLDALSPAGAAQAASDSAGPTAGLVTGPQSAPWVPRAAPVTGRARTVSRQEAD